MSRILYNLYTNKRPTEINIVCANFYTLIRLPLYLKIKSLVLIYIYFYQLKGSNKSYSR